MKSTKYQLLKDDFDHAVDQLRIKNKIIEELRKEVKHFQALHQSYLDMYTKVVGERNELISLNLWSARRLGFTHKEFAFNELEKITGEKHERFY
ncbi:hypothetical protein [Sutcliffiella halmapala]|uniref:hypothetical protein n=1 Tax=Sutcliffiella halmapala TaxID=79882 RepID=UPI0009949FF2|nr:hypothetical protein [Sutcliffiella halmapala]